MTHRLRMLRPGDLGYGQICELPEVTTLGRLAPLSIPPGHKASIVGLREKLRKKIAKQNRGLTAADLIRYRDDIRTVYLDMRDAMRTPPRLTNTDGDPLVLHTLTFRAGSAHAAFEALAPLARAFQKRSCSRLRNSTATVRLSSVRFHGKSEGNRIHKDSGEHPPRPNKYFRPIPDRGSEFGEAGRASSSRNRAAYGNFGGSPEDGDANSECLVEEIEAGNDCRQVSRQRGA